MTTKQTRANIDTKVHEDGAVSATVTHSDGTRQVVVVGASHKLMGQFAAHGLKAKLQAAINSGEDSKASAAKVDALEEAWSGDAPKWSLRDGEGGAKGGVLSRALAALKGVPVAEADGYVKKLSKAAQAQLRANPVVAAKIIELEGEARKDSGADALAGFLGSPDEDQREAA